MGVLSGRVNVHLVKQIDMFGLCVVSMKTHPFGNEWHTISDGLSNIMFTIEIVEGQDRPVKL